MKKLPSPAGTWTERSRRQLERALPWLPESAELAERLEAMQSWLRDEAEDIATRGDGIVSPGIVGMLSEAAANLAHAGEVRAIAMRCHKRGDEAAYVKYISAAAKLGDAAGLHITRARQIALAAKAGTPRVDPTDALMIQGGPDPGTNVIQGGTDDEGGGGVSGGRAIPHLEDT